MLCCAVGYFWQPSSCLQCGQTRSSLCDVIISIELKLRRKRINEMVRNVSYFTSDIQVSSQSWRSLFNRSDLLISLGRRCENLNISDLTQVERDRATLIQQTIRQLNTQFGRRGPRSRPMTIHRVKVTFKDEPGEGSGVARSFYTAVGEAFLSGEKLPPLEPSRSNHLFYYFYLF